MNKQLNINNADDFALMYFNKNLKRQEYHAYRFYRYKVYIYMGKDYNKTVIDNKKLVDILLQYIDSNYTSYNIIYDDILKLYTIEYYTD